MVGDNSLFSFKSMQSYLSPFIYTHLPVHAQLTPSVYTHSAQVYANKVEMMKLTAKLLFKFGQYLKLICLARIQLPEGMLILTMTASVTHQQNGFKIIM